MWFTILILIIIFNSSLQQIQYDATKFDTQLSQIYTNLDQEEDLLSSMMTNVIPVVKSIKESLSTYPRYSDLVIALENLQNVLDRQSSLDNYAPYENMSTCNDVNYKITTLEFDIKQYYSLWRKVASNLTEMYRLNVLVAHYYAVNLYYIGVGSTVQINIYSTIKNVNNIVVEYYRYAALLSRSIALEYNILVQLFYFKKKYCQCPTNVNTNVASNVSTLNDNIEYLESPLVIREKKIETAAAVAQAKNIQAVNSVQGSHLSKISGNLATISIFLTGLLTIDDYDSDPWTNISSCNSLLSHVGYVTFKYWDYVDNYRATARNFSYAVHYQHLLNASVIISTPTSAQLKTIQDVIEAMIIVHSELREYLNQLSWAIWQIYLVLVDVTHLSNNFCGCGGPTKATTKPPDFITTTEMSTSTTKPRTTTKLSTTTKRSATTTKLSTTTKKSTTSKATTIKMSTTTNLLTSTAEEPTTTEEETSTTEEPTTSAESTSTEVEEETTTEEETKTTDALTTSKLTSTTSSTTTEQPSSTSTTSKSTTTVSTTSTNPPTSTAIKPTTTSTTTQRTTILTTTTTPRTSTTTVTTTTPLITTSTTPRTSTTTVTTTTPLITTSTTPRTSTTTVTTTPLITTSTTPGPNTSSCYGRQELAINNAYVKTGCWIRTTMNFSQAASTCSKLGMAFFVIDNDSIYTAWKNWVNVLWPAGVTPSWVMNGIRNSNNFWGLYTSPTTALYTGLTWGTDAISGPACLTTERNSLRTIFTSYAVDCGSAKSFFCEYV